MAKSATVFLIIWTPTDIIYILIYINAISNIDKAEHLWTVSNTITVEIFEALLIGENILKNY